MGKCMVAACQMEILMGDLEENIHEVERFLKIAAKKGADIVVFPECALTGYSVRSREEAELLSITVDSDHIKNFAKICHEFQIYAVIGFIERDGAKLYNSVVMLGPNNFQAIHRKIHTSFVGIDRFVDEGNIPLKVYELPFGKIGFYICYDHNFPETARSLALDGVQLICISTNWNEQAKHIALALSKVRAFENNVFIACADRIGMERGNRFIGLSHITNQYGTLVAQAGEFQEEIIFASLDLDLADEKKIMVRENEYVDFMADRRVDFYHKIIK
ncbi:carbon-nitrogen hydrolase family protein [Methanobacterium alcaliphilum]|uniref:carbon-nitrogen hydrolase family protein n=1 Tax=Methanobacterium alcaliphilum TaxID=392018 RepID=UPI00200A705F|nr:carbon-nitrogen hydrolase family protein [Methanobacterium alcaliphilum]MCK9150875.1 carbon-nitrogen hydrolase family protein [Methanobacterium alcaliphilum]